MKTSLLVALAFVLFALPATVNAQDLVMDWNSTGQSLFAHWNISGTSVATLTPTSASTSV